MSRLDELIQQYCPNGVEYKTLNKVAKVTSGSSAPQDSESFSDDGTPFCRTADVGRVRQSVNFTEISDRITDKAAKGMKLMPVGTILIPKSGASTLMNNKVRLGVEAYVVSHLAAIIADKTQINDKYLYYALTTFDITTLVENPSYPSLKTTTIGESIDIPVPPLPVQQEIVRILDKFTELEAELEAELQLRKKQYEWHRDQLLTFRRDGGPDVPLCPWLQRLLDKYAPNGVEWKPIKDVFDIRNGYTPSKDVAEYWADGVIPWYRMEDIRQNGRILSDSIQHISESAIKNGKLFKSNSIILATTATIGEHAILIADSLANQRFTNFAIRESLSNKLLSKYVFYYFFKIDEWCKNNVKVGNFAAVDVDKLKKQLFPIPPLEVQEAIVSVLDKFSELCTDISLGLPAEIAARQKQYEYYRDKLLSFETKEN